MNASKPVPAQSKNDNLSSQYGRIGISAVAAASAFTTKELVSAKVTPVKARTPADEGLESA
jgi:hypothetical protein